jgi:hypothetical protein
MSKWFVAPLALVAALLLATRYAVAQAQYPA